MAIKFPQPFARFGGLFLFLFLEAIAFYMVVNFNKKHNQIYLNTAYAFTAAAYDRYDGINDYFSLKKQIEELQAENALLRNRLGIAKYENVLVRDSIEDLEDDSIRQKFTFIPAKIISNFSANANNIITIDCGTIQGADRDMGVIDGRGIVGIIKGVSPKYATVMSLLHQQTSISAVIKRTNAFGSLEWDGRNPNLLELKAIPKHADVVEGDTLITSGYGHHFPRGIPIGVIESKSLPPGSNFFTLKVRLINNLRRVRQVYVVDNLMYEEIKNLEEFSQ